MALPLLACAAPGDARHPLAAREHPEPEHAYRTPFERDRARIIHARAFRRLAGKTQVFSAGSMAGEPSDHFRSRLTHTMEVAQIARTMASALGLNAALTEALALVHDIGHPPFGHAGERALDRCLRERGLRFDHNLHALRIVEHFELRYAGFPGLNLTFGVREGIIKHSRDYTAEEYPQLAPYLLDRQPALEAQLIDLADEIAYLTADLDDGMEAGLLDLAHVRAGVPLFERFYAPMAAAHASAAHQLVFNEALKRMLNALVGDLLEATVANVRAFGASSLDEIRAAGHRLVGFSPEMERARLTAKGYLHASLYGSAPLKRDHATAEAVVRDLFEAWLANPALLPASYRARLESGQTSPARVIADYIAGMTDSFILTQYANLRADEEKASPS